MAVHTTADAPVTAGADALSRQFANRIKKLGVTVEHADSAGRVAALVAELAAAVPQETRRVVLAPAVEEAYPSLRKQLEGRGITLTAVDVSNPAATFGAMAIGVTRALLGVAETGTYAVADGLPDRLVRMLAFRHLVLLDRALLVPSLDEAGEWLKERLLGTNRYASFITGPSRTADIEMSLTVGAHGPAELRIVILDATDAQDGDER